MCETDSSWEDAVWHREQLGALGSNKFQKAEVTDISDDFNFVRSLFDLMVEGELCPEHLENVVEDFLSDGCPKIISFPQKSDDPLPVA